MYNINMVAESAKVKKKRSLLAILYLIIPFFMLVYWLQYHSISEKDSGRVFYFAILLPFLFIYICLGIAMVSTGVRKWNLSVRSLSFENNKIVIETFALLWKKGKTIAIFQSDSIELKESKFPWFQVKKEMEGMIIKIRQEKAIKELYLAKGFFDDYAEIVSKINNFKTLD